MASADMPDKEFAPASSVDASDPRGILAVLVSGRTGASCPATRILPLLVGIENALGKVRGRTEASSRWPAISVSC